MSHLMQVQLFKIWLFNPTALYGVLAHLSAIWLLIEEYEYKIKIGQKFKKSDCMFRFIHN